MCAMSYGMEWLTAQGSSRRMGHFSNFFSSFILLFRFQLRQKSSPGVSKWLLCSCLRSPEQLSTLCCLWELKTLHVLQKQTPSAFLRVYKYWLSDLFWLIQSVYPKSCLCWSQREAKVPALWIILISHHCRWFFLFGFFFWKTWVNYIS